MMLDPAPAPDAAPAPPRAPWKWALRLALGAVVVWLLARGASQDLLESIGRAPPLLLAACVAAYWAGQFLSVRRWQTLLDALADTPGTPTPGPGPRPIGWRECLGWYAAGMFWNLWMPTGLGGDAARALLAGRRAQDGARGALSVVLDRVLGLASLLLLAIAALVADAALGRASLAGGSVRQARHVLLACAVGGACLLALAWALARFSSRSARVLDAEASGWKGKAARALAPLLAMLASGGGGGWRRASVLGPILALSLSVQAIQIGINIALARAVGLPIEPASMAWVAPVLALSSAVPLGIGGLGAREAGAVALLGGAFGHGDVLAWSLLWQAVVWLSSLLGAPSAWRWRHLNASAASQGAAST